MEEKKKKSPTVFKITPGLNPSNRRVGGGRREGEEVSDAKIGPGFIFCVCVCVSSLRDSLRGLWEDGSSY